MWYSGCNAILKSDVVLFPLHLGRSSVGLQDVSSGFNHLLAGKTKSRLIHDENNLQLQPSLNDQLTLVFLILFASPRISEAITDRVIDPVSHSCK